MSLAAAAVRSPSFKLARSRVISYAATTMLVAQNSDAIIAGAVINCQLGIAN
jgi:hypothetical protein